MLVRRMLKEGRLRRFVFGTPDRPPGQIQLEAIWNKKLNLLLEAIDTVGN